MLFRRFATAFVFIPPFFLGILTDTPGQLVLAAMGSACSIWGLSEFFDLAARRGAHPPRFWMYLVAAVSPFLVYAHHAAHLGYSWLALWAVVGWVGLLAAIVFFGRIDQTLETLTVSVTGILYVCLPLLIVQVFRQWTGGVWLILFVFVTTWMSDTGAFFGGQRFGKHKMAPSISPGKTWEGFLSGILVSLLSILVLGGLQCRVSGAFFWSDGYPEDIVRLLFLNILLVLTGTLGDLAESMLKRDVGVKDSGSPLTGHGGFLDIMDSLLVNLPLLYVWCRIIEDLP